jgi:hypothetical protein
MRTTLRSRLDFGLGECHSFPLIGYQDEKYFSKVFKKSEGVSPNEYRKQV